MLGAVCSLVSGEDEKKQCEGIQLCLGETRPMLRIMLGEKHSKGSQDIKSLNKALIWDM